jgi:hypothetical protein
MKFDFNYNNSLYNIEINTDPFNRLFIFVFYNKINIASGYIKKIDITNYYLSKQEIRDNILTPCLEKFNKLKAFL